ncbi:hypothetical protein ILYODFUR_011853 [Ilyodon furcidens]|uniref:Secreted protein n=1 Tax=Ilyodon furcidens TaxID=33524 RepID=A0ABV0SZW4_9TELE
MLILCSTKMFVFLHLSVGSKVDWTVLRKTLVFSSSFHDIRYRRGPEWLRFCRLNQGSAASTAVPTPHTQVDVLCKLRRMGHRRHSGIGQLFPHVKYRKSAYPASDRQSGEQLDCVYVQIWISSTAGKQNEGEW